MALTSRKKSKENQEKLLTKLAEGTIMFSAQTGRKEKKCLECFAYVPANARKCKFCKYVFKSPGKFIFDRIKEAFNVKTAYPGTSKPPETEAVNFTDAEIDRMLQPQNIKVLMYLVLSDYNYLDETSLLELGETLSAMP